ncbi:MAG: hypothetical protein ACK504_07680 [Bacteroidota bacterium]
MNKKNHILFFMLLMISSVTIRSQNIAVGTSLLYNVQTESFGSGIRVNVFPNKRISFTPQISYFFSFNKIHEYTLGLAIEGKFIERNKINLYGILHGGYNSWLNYKSSGLKDAKPNNWNLEGGIGISTNTCLRPFLEYRYNVKFKETHLNLGFIYIFGCKKNNRYLIEKCPTFN